MNAKNILVVIITYNPEISFLKNNLTKFSQSDILIVDNDSYNVEEINKLDKEKSISIILNDKNLGIAEALNQGLNFASANGYQYILTMDQDSTFKNNFLSLKEGFNQFDRVAIVCPSIIDINSNNSNVAKNKFEEVFTTITSGCLCEVYSIMDVGGFDSKLFIDYVDYDICLKLQLKKYKILRSRDVVLNHTLGESKTYKFLGINLISTNHNPFRRYYNARNRVYLALKYKSIFPRFVIQNQLSFFKTILIIVFLEKNKFQKIKAILKGIRDAFKMK